MTKRKPTVSIPAIKWWPTAHGECLHAVPTERPSWLRGPQRSLCGFTPVAGWSQTRARFVEPQCRNCLRAGSRPIQVTSISVRAIAHSATTSTLDVIFHKGGQYRYYGVPRHIFEALLTSPSVGARLAALDKDGGYKRIRHTGGVELEIA